ncbi:MAG: four helix bundle protein [Paludibacter sp.]|jgi:four helix bundle protein|nr:four helix bundle protein [Paludibacter sp.]
MSESIILVKSFDFAVRIVNLSKYLVAQQKEFVLSKQILRSGTSIGANSEEADAAQSKKEFIAKLEIVIKEARETHFWLRLLHKTDYIDENMFESMLSDCNEIIAIVIAIIKTTRKNLDKGELK